MNRRRAPWRVEPAPCPDPGEVADLERRLAEEAVQSTGYDDAADLAGFVRGVGGATAAGVYGWTWGGCCELQHLWVDPARRSQGVGSALLAWAEEEARGRGCVQVVLFTHEHQAPDFYLRHGFELVSRISDYPVGGAALALRKRLDDRP